jgi:ribosome-associated protein
MVKMNSNDDENNRVETEYAGPSKSQLKRDSHHFVDIGEEILKLSREDIQSLNLPDELEVAINTALKIKSRSGLNRLRLYIGKLLRSMG